MLEVTADLAGYRTLDTVQLQENIPLAPFTTFKIGGPARFYTRVTTEAELREALTLARAEHLPTFLLGGGSNLLVADEGFPGLVIHLALTPSIERRGDLLEVSAGTDWDTLVRYTCEHDLAGMECLAGIPGLTGACPIQNIGAYGQEIASSLAHVSGTDLHTLASHKITNSACKFSYRSSIFNTTHRNRFAITAVTFRLNPGGTPTLTYKDLKQYFNNQSPSLTNVYKAVHEIRRSKGMVIVAGDPDTLSAGSFFKNPIVSLETLACFSQTPPNWPTGTGCTKLPAAWLLDQADFHKGFQMGEAGISSRHTLALTNRTGRATCSDILNLRDTIVAEVQARFGITLEQEPVYLS